MTYRKKAARAATPANARLPLTVEAAPVNLGELGVVGVVVFFAGAELPVPTGICADVWLAKVVGQALTVMVTTDGTTGLTDEWAFGMEVVTGWVEFE
jgi:hypothetical protein